MRLIRTETLSFRSVRLHRFGRNVLWIYKFISIQLWCRMADARILNSIILEEYNFENCSANILHSRPISTPSFMLLIPQFGIKLFTETRIKDYLFFKKSLVVNFEVSANIIYYMWHICIGLINVLFSSIFIFKKGKSFIYFSHFCCDFHFKKGFMWKCNFWTIVT